VLHRGVDRVIVINDGRIQADMDPDTLVSSDILAKNGIREPLYVTAMKYAGIDVKPELKPGHIWSLQTDKISQALRDWYKSVQPLDNENHNPSQLKLDQLSFSYDGIRPILDTLNINIRQGEMLSIVGRNGAGKSTLAKVVCGFVREDHGAVLYEGQNIRSRSIKERAEIIGFVMQNPNQMISKSLIFDEVALGLRLRKIPEEEIKSRVDKVLDICGLSPFISWPISALSYGQKKRVTIASILVLDPCILILDEPTAGQDYHHYSDIMDFLREINRLGITIILITHDMHLMLEYTPRAVVLSGGLKIADTRASDVLTDLHVIQQANLKETSLYYLAQKVGLPDETSFVQRFIDYESQVAK
jgi:energy-coupling factor transporter ATP-binding protein EcfA2